MAHLDTAFLVETFHDRPREERHHELVVARDLVAGSATECGTLNDVQSWPVLSQHVQIAGREAYRFSAGEIARD